MLARVFALTTPADNDLWERAWELLDTHNSFDYNQAMMDLGATICTPKNPDCARCPWQNSCQAFQRGLTREIPARSPKKARPELYATALVMHDKHGRVFLRQRLVDAPESVASYWRFMSASASRLT